MQTFVILYKLLYTLINYILAVIKGIYIKFIIINCYYLRILQFIINYTVDTLILAILPTYVSRYILSLKSSIYKNFLTIMPNIDLIIGICLDTFIYRYIDQSFNIAPTRSILLTFAQYILKFLKIKQYIDQSFNITPTRSILLINIKY